MEFDEKMRDPPRSFARLAMYRQVQEQATGCDVTIYVGTWRKKFHWSVLEQSPFFERMRRHDFIETRIGVVWLNVATPENVETAILFLYGRNPMLTEVNVESILHLAEFLLIPNLKSACVSFLEQVNVTKQNYVQLLTLSSLYDFDLLSCYTFLVQHMRDFIKTKEAKYITKESLVDVLTNHRVSSLTTDAILAFVVKWACRCKQNRIALPDILKVIDLGDPRGNNFQSFVLHNPVIAEVFEREQHMLSRNRFQDNTVLMFPSIISGGRIACFNMNNEIWCGIETGLPGNIRNNFSKYTIDGSVSNSSEIYRISNRNGSSKVCIQDLDSKSAFVCTVFPSDNPLGDLRLCFCCIEEQTVVTVSNERQKVNRRPQHTLNVSSGEMYTDTSTIYCGHIEFPNTQLHPMLTILDADITLICINSSKHVACLTRNERYLYISDILNGQLDKISLDDYFSSEHKYSGVHFKLASKEDGFVCYDNKLALIISCPSNSEDRKYVVHKLDLEYSREWDSVFYFYNDNTWFRFLRRTRSPQTEFACVENDALVNIKTKNLYWRQLPCPKNVSPASLGENVFMLKLPLRMLNCHLNCPYCDVLE